MRWLEPLQRQASSAANGQPSRPQADLVPEHQLTSLEREFLPPLLAIEETPPSPLNRILLWTLLALIASLILWSTVGKVSIVATAPGKFIPDGRLKEVQPLEPSIVEAIEVHDGERVRKGQLLIRLDPTLSAAQLHAAAERYGFNRLEQARIVGQLTGRQPDFAALDASRADWLLEQRIAQAQQADYRSKVAGAEAAIEEKSAALAAARSSAAKYQQLTTLSAQQVASARPLVPIGAISRVDYLKLEQALIANREDAAAAEKTVLQDEAALTEAHQALVEIRRGHIDSLYHALAQRVANAPTLQGEVAKSRRLYGLDWLRSPVDGIVQSVNVTTTGQVVNPAQSLVTLVPDDTPLMIEATVSNDDIGYLRLGQPVQVKVDTFPFEQYGTLPGKLIWISPDAEDREATARDFDLRTGALSGANSRTGRDLNAGFVYRVHIRVERAHFRVNGQLRSVEPGMTVEADIETGRRRVIEFFLAPLVKYLNEGVKVR